MKVLVTGADDFIGSHLVEWLVKAGVCVKALNYYNFFSSWGWLDTIARHVMREVEVTVGGSRDASYVARITTDCTHISHLAEALSATFDWYLIPENLVKFKAQAYNI